MVVETLAVLLVECFEVELRDGNSLGCRSGLAVIFLISNDHRSNSTFVLTLPVHKYLPSDAETYQAGSERYNGKCACDQGTHQGRHLLKTLWVDACQYATRRCWHRADTPH